MTDSRPRRKAGGTATGSHHNFYGGLHLKNVMKPTFCRKIATYFPLAATMLKGSLPMIISLAIYQSDSIAKRYSTVGYIMAIVSFFSMAILPRAKYLEGLVLNMLATLIGSALSLLTMWCGIKARQHTTTPGSIASYNSSQAAVCAIWLFCTQWAAGTIRAKSPLLQNCIYMFSVLTMITMTYAPRFQTMEQAILLIKELLEIFFIAFGISTGVSLLIFPTTTRMVLFRKHNSYFTALREFAFNQSAYYRALSTPNEPKLGEGTYQADSRQKTSFHERETLIGSLDRLIALHMELYTHTIDAKREVAYGKLNADDLQHLFRAFHAILTPMAGIKTIIELFDDLSSDFSAVQKEESFETTEAISEMQKLFADITEVIADGLQHAAIVLEYLPTQENQSDLESNKPGASNFASYLDRKIRMFHDRQSEFLRSWVKARRARNETMSRIPAEQFYLIFHMEYLIYSIAISVYRLVLLADSKVNDGTMARKRLVFPCLRHFSRMLGHTMTQDSRFTHGQSGEDQGTRLDSFEEEAADVNNISPFNALERITNYLCVLPRFLRSKESAFGLRMALAVLSIGILAYLEDTWVFYYQQRLIWPLIVILVAMNVGSGESTFKLIAQAIGAAVAMVISYICWYIVDGKPAGVLVFMWLAFFALFYGFVKVPRLFSVWLCILVPIISVLGTSLQSKKLGHALVVASGQIDYPVYLGAPYRLLTVLAGCLVAYVWTVFPYPMTDRGLLSEKLGDVIFLLAKYQDCGNSIAKLKIKSMECELPVHTLHHASRVQKVSDRLFHQIMTLISSLRMHAFFQRFEVPIGGKFPVRSYMAVMQEATSIMNYTNLLIHSSQSWQQLLLDPATSLESSPSLFPDDTAARLAAVSTNSHHIMSTLTLFSASVKYGIPLPSCFQAPPKVDLSSVWKIQDAESWDGKVEKHGDHAVYWVWAMIQIIANKSNSALSRMVVEIKELNGEVNFELEDE